MTLRFLEDQPGVRLVLGEPGRRARIAFDRALGVIVRRSRWLRPARIAIADLDRIRMTVSREHAIELAIRYRQGPSMAEVQHAFAVRDLDLDHEALDLAFRIAQICRLGGFVVRDDASTARTIDLVPQAPDDSSPYRTAFPALRSIAELAGAVQGVPPIRDRASYRAERARFREPEPPAAPPRSGSRVAGIMIGAWDPPHLTLKIPATLTRFGAVWNALRYGMASFITIAFAVALAIGFESCRRFLFSADAGFYSWKDYVAFVVAIALWILVGLAAIGGTITAYESTRLTIAKVRRDLRHRGARRIAIERDTVTIETEDRREIATADIDGVTLRLHGKPPEQWAEIELVLADDDALLAVTSTIDPTQREDLEGVAIGIARALDVPYRLDAPKAE